MARGKKETGKRKPEETESDYSRPFGKDLYQK